MPSVSAQLESPSGAGYMDGYSRPEKDILSLTVKVNNGSKVAGTFSTKTTCPAAHRASGKGPETAIHWLVIFRLTKGPESAAYLPHPDSRGMSQMPQRTKPLAVVGGTI
jgi:hypothetical protein